MVRTEVNLRNMNANQKIDAIHFLLDGKRQLQRKKQKTNKNLKRIGNNFNEIKEYIEKIKKIKKLKNQSQFLDKLSNLKMKCSPLDTIFCSK